MAFSRITISTSSSRPEGRPVVLKVLGVTILTCCPETVTSLWLEGLIPSTVMLDGEIELGNAVELLKITTNVSEPLVRDWLIVKLMVYLE